MEKTLDRRRLFDLSEMFELRNYWISSRLEFKILVAITILGNFVQLFLNINSKKIRMFKICRDWQKYNKV